MDDSEKGAVHMPTAFQKNWASFREMLIPKRQSRGQLLRDAGITFCLVSNNWHEGVYHLANRLSLPIVAKAVKPLPPAFLMALRKLGAKRSETVVIGDQLVTDVMGAHFLGMKAYLLAPLVEQDLPHTLLLRNFERVVMGERKPEGAASTSQNAVPCEDEEPDAQGV